MLAVLFQVIMAPDCIGPEVEKMVNDLKPGQVLLLENVRFHKEEERNDDAFATKVSGQSLAGAARLALAALRPGQGLLLHIICYHGKEEGHDDAFGVKGGSGAFVD